MRLFLETSPEAERVPVEASLAKADARVPALLANPELAYEVEEAGGVRDEFLTLEQEIPLAGRRRLVAESATAAGSAARLSAESALLVTIHDVRAAFYEIVYRQEDLALLDLGEARMRRIVEILVAREREGESSGYDRLRAEQELAEVQLTRSEEGAALSDVRARFGAFFDPAQGMQAARLEGTLALGTHPPSESQALESALSWRKDLASLRATAERLGLDKRAADRLKYPVPTFAAGWKRTEALDLSETGFVASVSLSLPVFDRGQLDAARAGASRQRVTLEIDKLERSIGAEVSALLARERATREALERHQNTSAQRAADLRQIAELAYEEGEAGILELLDAYRTTLAAERRALSLRYAAKRAEINRERALGSEVVR